MFSETVYLPRVTLLIPCFDSKSYVGDAINCALAQTYGHVEIIVAPDDGETYQELRSKFTSPQLRIIAPGSKSGTGAGPTRNRAIDASKGDFFTILDADDLIAPTYVESLMKVAMKEGAAISNTRYTQWDASEVVRVPPVHNRCLSLSGFSQLLSSMHPLIHRSFEIGYENCFAEDVIHDGLIIAKMNTISIVPDNAYTLRIRRGSACNSDENGSENRIQAEYAKLLDQVLFEPTAIGIQALSFRDRHDFAELFRFRAYVSKKFSESASTCYNAWVAGKEASLFDAYLHRSRSRVVGQY